MKKKKTMLFAALVLIFTMFQITALAAPGDVHYGTATTGSKVELIGGAPNWVFFKQGSPPSNGIAAVWTLEELDNVTKEAYFEEIKSIDNSVSNLLIEDVYFFYSDQIITNSNSNTGEYQVIKEMGKWYVYIISGSISHFYYSEGREPLGSLKVTADVAKKYEVVDYYKEWAQDYAKEWAQDYAKEWAQDYAKEWAQDFAREWAQDYAKEWAQDFAKEWAQDYAKEWAQDYAKEWAQDYLRIYIPIFEKRMDSETGTLVSGITYGYGTDGTSNLPGGYLMNGMTYLKVNNIMQYTEDNPLMVWIADSSPNNGRKGPTEYNRNKGYFYELYVKDGKVFIGFDDRLISAKFGILVSDTIFKANPTRYVKHNNNIDGTAVNADKNGNTYVFFHGTAVSWYVTNEYEFVRWDFLRNENSGDPYLTGNEFNVGTPYLTGNVFDVGASYLTGNQFNVGTPYLTGNEFNVGVPYLTGNVFDVGDPYLTGNVFDVEDPYLTGNEFNVGVPYLTGNEFNVGDPYLTGNTFYIESSRRLVDDVYDVMFDLVVTKDGGAEVYNGKLKNNDQVVIPNLEPGNYTAVLSSSDFTDQIKYALVVADAQAIINFNDITVYGPERDGDYISASDVTIKGLYQLTSDTLVKGLYQFAFDTLVTGIYQPAFDTYIVGSYQPAFDSLVKGLYQAAFDTYVTGLYKPAFDTYIIGVYQAAFDTLIAGIYQSGFDTTIPGMMVGNVYLGSTDPEDPESIANGIYTPPRT